MADKRGSGPIWATIVGEVVMASAVRGGGTGPQGWMWPAWRRERMVGLGIWEYTARMLSFLVL